MYVASMGSEKDEMAEIDSSELAWATNGSFLVSKVFWIRRDLDVGNWRISARVVSTG
jgi:hypothetical protein